MSLFKHNLGNESELAYTLAARWYDLLFEQTLFFLCVYILNWRVRVQPTRNDGRMLAKTKWKPLFINLFFFYQRNTLKDSTFYGDNINHHSSSYTLYYYNDIISIPALTRIKYYCYHNIISKKYAICREGNSPATDKECCRTHWRHRWF